MVKENDLSYNSSSEKDTTSVDGPSFTFKIKEV